MTIPSKIIKFLEKAKVKYEPIKHRMVYTAFDKAATLKMKPNIIGKTLVLKTDKDLVVILIPGNKNLDKNKFKKLINDGRKKEGQKPVKNIDFISEKLMKNKFKGVKVGAIPPSGNLFKLATFVDKGLLKNPKIIINAGNYNWSIKIKGTDLKKIASDLFTGNFITPRSRILTCSARKRNKK